MTSLLACSTITITILDQNPNQTWICCSPIPPWSCNWKSGFYNELRFGPCTFLVQNGCQIQTCLTKTSVVSFSANVDLLNTNSIMLPVLQIKVTSDLIGEISKMRCNRIYQVSQKTEPKLTAIKPLRFVRII